MTLEKAKEELTKFVRIKTTLWPEFASVLTSDDIAEVVRCKDCKYCLQDEFEYWCNGFCSPARLVRKEDFCSNGKARN